MRNVSLGARPEADGLRLYVECMQGWARVGVGAKECLAKTVRIDPARSPQNQAHAESKFDDELLLEVVLRLSSRRLTVADHTAWLQRHLLEPHPTFHHNWQVLHCGQHTGADAPG